MSAIKSNRLKRMKKVNKKLSIQNPRRPQMQNQPTLAPGLLPGIRPDALKKITCKKCGEEGEMFIPISKLRHASPLQTVMGQPMVVNFVIGYACLKCSAINEFSIEGVVPTAPSTDTKQ